MKNTLIVSLSCLLLSLFATAAHAERKPGQYAGVHECTATAGAIQVNATSKRTIGVATCKTELQKALIAKGACDGKKKREKVVFQFQFGADDDPAKTTGSGNLYCR